VAEGSAKKGIESMTLDEAIADRGSGSSVLPFLVELKLLREWREFIHPIMILEAENGEHISIFRTMHHDMFRIHRDGHGSELVTVKSIKIV
jgi:hypothetical protein